MGALSRPLLFASLLAAASLHSTSVGAWSRLSRSTSHQSNSNQGSTTSSPSSFRSYPDSTAGLEALITDMLNLERQGDKKRLGPLLQSLVLPHAKEWFASNFGNQGCGNPEKGPDDCMGPRLAATYALTANMLSEAAALTLNDLLDEKLTNVEAVNYTEPCPGPQRIHPARKLTDELTTTPILSPVLSGLVQNHVPVYVLWAYSDTQETTLTFFIYAEGAFRYMHLRRKSRQSIHPIAVFWD